MKKYFFIFFIPLIITGCFSYPSNSNLSYYQPSYRSSYIPDKPVFNMESLLNTNFYNFTKTKLIYTIQQFDFYPQIEERIEEYTVLPFYRSFKEGDVYLTGYFIEDRLDFITIYWFHGLDISKNKNINTLHINAGNIEDSIIKIAGIPYVSSMFHSIEQEKNWSVPVVDIIRATILDEEYKSIWVYPDGWKKFTAELTPEAYIIYIYI